MPQCTSENAPHAAIDIRSRMPQAAPRMTPRLVALLLLLPCPVLWAQQSAPRIAVVRVMDIYNGLESTTQLQQQARQEREEILRDQRAVDLRRIIAEMREIETTLRDKNKPLDEEGTRRLARAFEIKRQEAQTLQREFESYRSEREREINRRMVTAMRATLNAISEASQRTAREHGYDLLFDSSGNTNTGAPFIIYQKNAPDLTDAVAAALRDATNQPAN